MRKILWFAIIAILLQAPSASADSPAQTMEILQKMQKQMTDMQRTIDAQNLRIQQLESKKVLETPQPSVGLQPGAQAAATMSDKDFQASLKNNIGKVIPWLEGAKVGGDFRLRYEAFDYFDKNNDAGSTGTASDRSRNRFRIRLRWGFEKDYGDDWTFGYRMATGNTTDQVSTNQTLGNSGYFNFKSFNIERAYVTYTPSDLKNRGAISDVTLGAGKFENPFLRYSTPIVWDSDVTPEGAYQKVNFQLHTGEDNKLNLYTTLGEFILNENTGSDTDASLMAAQAALTWSTYRLHSDLPVDLTLASSIYNYTDWFQTVTNNSAGTSYLRTNTLVADDFKVLDIYPEVQFYVDRTPVTLWYDYVKNLNNVGTKDIVQSGGNDIHDQDEAWGLGFKFGKTKKKGDWDLQYGYYEIGTNAVVAAFNDADLGGPGQNGFTNRKGHKLGLGYQMTDNIVVNWTGLVVRPLNPSVQVANSTNEHVFRSQLDLNYKF
ncbi:MAG: putative porin [Candidatus Omnitrophica bacterium]|nr:putative porin [Candidatus Omnitrophota bacterium]